MKQITIFGGSGFIGRHLIGRLAREGYIIRVPTRDAEKALRLKPAGDVGQIVPISCSVRSDASVARAIGNSDAVVNLIGILCERGRNTFQSLHVEAAARIARLARERGAKSFVHVSALGADAQSPSKYARSKAAGEKAVRTFFPDAAILRPALVFGPEDDFFNRFAGMMRLLPVLPVIGMSTKFQPAYVGDVAAAICAALDRFEARRREFELGGPGVYSFRELLELIMAETGRRALLVPMPWRIAKFTAGLCEMLPGSAITRDQVELLKRDNILRDAHAGSFRDLGVTPAALEMILPTYLDRFRLGGRLKPA